MLCSIATHLALILTLLVTVVRPADSWMTTYQSNFQLACPAGQTVRRLESFFGVGQYDRVWNMSCSILPNWVDLSSCEWSGAQNNYNEVLIFQCPSDYIVTGIASTYDRSKLDRIWSFQCCNPQDYVTHECMYTSFINTYGDVMNYRVPNDHVLRGVESIYDQNRRDRLYKFDICKLAPVDFNNHVIVG
ncbi:unnamed protein product [Lymnaea stagnalis]|uniref:Dermatopontin n=1 Tax=Lymnaea stagnalis TaxID=6523 RepID=A0AAV2IKP2_LYMST